MLLRLLRPRLRTYRGPLAAIVFLQLVQTAAALYLPTLNADIVDDGIVKGDTRRVVVLGGLMIVTSVVQFAGLFGAGYFSARTASRIGGDVRAALFDRVQEFSGREMGHFGVPSLVMRTTNDVQQVQTFVMTTLSMAVFAPMMGFGSVLMALHQSVQLSGLLLVVVPALGAVIVAIVVKALPMVKRMAVSGDRLGRIMREQIIGVRVVRAFVREEHERVRFARAGDELYEAALGSGRAMSLMFPSVVAVINLAAIVILWFGAHRIADGSMQVGMLAAFLIYLMQVLLAVMTATFVLVMLPRAQLSATRLQQVLDTPTSLTPAAAPVAVLPEPGLLELTNVEFRYPGAEQPVLRDICLTARPGETVAIIGGTGSGKSTLLNLIARLLDATGGRVAVGGTDVRDLDPAVLARAVSYVPQRAYLFAGTIASNLRYGDPDATDDELWHALEVAEARDFVERLPDGLNTATRQGGTTLSGGQRQRLAVARALVRRADVYLLDDPFSALDYATDSALRAALLAESSGATVVIVAQRVSTVRDADRIVVLDEGQVVGVGRHQDLMTTNEVYREIALSQLDGQETVGPAARRS
ncbi:ABC transporter ATP-binding protein [Dactylosporangium roseum]|uniref:ABC transporter ATP-binding protein n=1 Tax=Dactylosporangium roseum TaxID=47989 RepID=A0ABY5YZJ0_9ACTN|nr:ABC transporter ATP-binding protein [Dactylosporangium roseum]UWZ34786.1 ABC transporter ATP-binding protein [Dactylosporangium roseum]